jgi:hypothetical protein
VRERLNRVYAPLVECQSLVLNISRLRALSLSTNATADQAMKAPAIHPSSRTAARLNAPPARFIRANEIAHAARIAGRAFAHLVTSQPACFRPSRNSGTKRTRGIGWNDVGAVLEAAVGQRQNCLGMLIRCALTAGSGIATFKNSSADLISTRTALLLLWQPPTQSS